MDKEKTLRILILLFGFIAGWSLYDLFTTFEPLYKTKLNFWVDLALFVTSAGLLHVGIKIYDEKYTNQS